MTKSKYVLEKLGKLTKFLENTHTMASELSKNNGMSIRLYNPDIVLSIIRHSSPCPLATQSINEFLQNLDLLLTEKPSDRFPKLCQVSENAGAPADPFVDGREEHSDPHRKHSSIQPGITDAWYS